MKTVLSKIAALLAFGIGIMAIYAGGKAVLDVWPNLSVVKWLTTYNLIAGVITVILTAPLIWKNSRFALPVTIATLLLAAASFAATRFMWRRSVGRIVEEMLRQPAPPVARDLQHGMRDEVDLDAVLREDDPDGIDQERHVVGHDGDQGVRRGEAVALPVRVEDAHQRLVRGAQRREPRVRDRHRREVVGLARREVLLADAVVEGADQVGGGQRRLASGRPGCARRDALDDPEAFGGDVAKHGEGPLRSRPQTPRVDRAVPRP